MEDEEEEEDAEDGGDTSPKQYQQSNKLQDYERTFSYSTCVCEPYSSLVPLRPRLFRPVIVTG